MDLSTRKTKFSFFACASTFQTQSTCLPKWDRRGFTFQPTVLYKLSLALLERQEFLNTLSFELPCKCNMKALLVLLLNNLATGNSQFWCRRQRKSCPSLAYFSRCWALTVLLYQTLLSYLFKLLGTTCYRVKTQLMGRETALESCSVDTFRAKLPFILQSVSNTQTSLTAARVWQKSFDVFLYSNL